MASTGFRRWTGERADQLDEFERVLGSLTGRGLSRRWAARQIAHAYAVLLASQFQGFCRDLHSECAEHIALAVAPRTLRTLVRAEFAHARRLDRGNPNPGNIGSDFNRLGLSFWTCVFRDDSRNDARQRKLQELNQWRNAITHQDFDPASLEPPRLTLRVVHSWRGACNGMAISFDRVMGDHLRSILGHASW